MRSISERYAQLLRKWVKEGEESSLMSEAMALGRDLDAQGVPWAALEEIHAEVVARLAASCPEITLGVAAPRIAEVMLEVGRAYVVSRRRRLRDLRSEEASDAGFADEEFLSLLTHELRTPLSPILTWAEILQVDEMDPEEQRQSLDAIVRGARSLQGMIDDVSVAARSPARPLAFHPEPVDLTAVLVDVVEAIRFEAEARDLQLVDSIARGLTTQGQPRFLAQIFRNLLGNAVKFTPREGRVELEAARDGARIQIKICDTGPGLTAEQRAELFQQDWAVPSDIARRHKGLGLGLAVVHRLVQLHGGAVSLQDPGPTGGSVFVVDLEGSPEPPEPGEAAEPPEPAEAAVTDRPCETSAGETEYGVRPSLAEAVAPTSEPSGIVSTVDDEASRSSEFDGVRVLVVDDDASANAATRGLLERHGVQSMGVATAGEALNALETFNPLILVSELVIPVHDGYALMVAVRDIETRRGAARRLTVALSDQSLEPDRRKAVAAGFDAVVSKPIEVGEFLDTLRVLLARA